MKVSYSYAGIPVQADYQQTSDGLVLHLEDGQTEVRVLEFVPPRLTCLVHDRLVTAYVVAQGNKRWVHIDGETYELERRANIRPGARMTESGESSETVTAPMPGQVRQVHVRVGDRVQEGQPLVLLEAMKMEIRVTAPHNGRVTRLDVEQGQSVEREQILALVKVEHDPRQIL